MAYRIKRTNNWTIKNPVADRVLFFYAECLLPHQPFYEEHYANNQGNTTY
jgi:hypothetical protein